MRIDATTVEDYLAKLPPDRRASLETVRAVFREHLDPEFEEGIQYGMIGYYVPHRVYPPGYHCDPKQPLPFAGLASQKNHLSIYLMCVYGDSPLASWFQEAWRATGKRLDMGKACIRFRSADHVPLEVLAELLRRMPARTYIQHYESARNGTAPSSEERSGSRPAAKKARSSPVKKAARPAGRKSGGASTESPPDKSKGAAKPAASAKPAKASRRKASAKRSRRSE